MSKPELTTAVIFIDGFGGIALTDVSKTHKELIDYLNDESVWEVFDSLVNKPRGEYLVTISFWLDANYDDEFITEIKEATLTTNS